MDGGLLHPAPKTQTIARTRGKGNHQGLSELDRVVNLLPTAKETPMNALVISVLVTVGISSAALAQQQRSVRDMMNDMKARYGQTFDECQALAVSRGYRLSDDEYEGRGVMMFIEGCIMGKQR
jgi:hypothetical protein